MGGVGLDHAGGAGVVPGFRQRAPAGGGVLVEVLPGEVQEGVLAAAAGGQEEYGEQRECAMMRHGGVPSRDQRRPSHSP